MGGVGKTTLARMWGRYYAHSHPASVVFEINAETQTALLSSFRELSIALTQTSRQQEEINFIEQIRQPAEKEKRRLSYVKSRLRELPGWLLIYDNMEKLQNILPYLPQDSQIWGQGQVLITTRNSHIKNAENIKYTNIIELDSLTEQETLTLFTRIRFRCEPEELSLDKYESIASFIKHIPPFPLDVSVAARYMSNQNLSYDQYLIQLQQQDTNLSIAQEAFLQETSEYLKTRYSIIATSLKHIIETNIDFQKSLLLISLLDSHRIPRVLLEHQHPQATTNHFFHELKKFCLITEELTIDNISVFSIHRSTQAICLLYLTQALCLTPEHPLLSSINTILEYCVNSAIDVHHYAFLKVLAPHCEAFLTHADQSKIKLQLGKLYFCLGDNNNAKLYLEQGIAHVESASATNGIDQNLLRSKVYLGAVLDELSQHDAAQTLLEKCITIYNEKLPNDKEELAFALLHLGKVYSQQGKYQLSETALLKSIALCQQIATLPLHNLTKAQTLLTETYMYSGQYKKAEPYFESLITQYQPNDPQILWIQLRLGRLYMFTGEYGKARRIFEQGVAILKDKHADDKGKLGWNITYLGDVYRSLGLFDKAKEAILEGFELFKRLYGSDHIITTWVEGYLGRLYCDIGSYQEAKQLLEKSLGNHQQKYGEQKKRYVFVMQALANVYAQLGNFEKAQMLFEECLFVYRTQFGEQHTEYALVLRDCGHSCALAKKYERAEKFLNQAHAILQDTQHIEAYRCLEYLGDLFEERRKTETQPEKTLNYLRKKNSYYQQALKLIISAVPTESAHKERIMKKGDHD